MNKVLTIIVVAAVVVGLIIWYMTGAIWQAIPIGMAIWVTTLAKKAIENDGDNGTSPQAKNGTKTP